MQGNEWENAVTNKSRLLEGRSEASRLLEGGSEDGHGRGEDENGVDGGGGGGADGRRENRGM